ncbi:MAG: hypothetical protein ABSD96_15680 [Candidatus Korobacteraceae bacterium]|jgi:hypothetical protein
MRKFILVCCIPFLLTLSALAQSVEISGNYAHLTGPFGKDGFNITAAYLATHHLALEGDVGGYFASNNSSDRVYDGMAGPKVMFSTHDALFTPYAHLLVGGAHEMGNGYLAVMPGGGVDVGSKRFAVRLELDAMHFNSDTHARAGVGLVLRW